MTTDQHNLTQTAEKLVRESILGTRKGMPDQPTYLHSFHVSKLLRNYGFNEDVCLAGLLHDVIEDSDVTVTKLQELGIPNNVIELVLLCTHDSTIQNNDLRWVLMIVNLAKADSRDAWAIKLADVFDNFIDSHALTKERSNFMRDIKIPTLLKASKHQIGQSRLWIDLQETHSKTVELTASIEKSIVYVQHEVSNVLMLSEEAKNAVLRACNAVLDTNYGLNNPRLFEAIIALHNTMEQSSKDSSSVDHTTGLSILGNGLCGDMLMNLKDQKILSDSLKETL